MQILAFAPASMVAPVFKPEPVMTTLVAAGPLGERLGAGLAGKARRMRPPRRRMRERSAT